MFAPYHYEHLFGSKTQLAHKHTHYEHLFAPCGTTSFGFGLGTGGERVTYF